jgi:hypothetical protein
MYKASVIAWTVVVLLFTTTSAGDLAQCDVEKGLLELYKDQFRGLVNGKINRLQVANLGEHQYSALKSIIGPPPPPIDDCWPFFDQYIASCQLSNLSVMG